LNLTHPRPQEREKQESDGRLPETEPPNTGCREEKRRTFGQEPGKGVRRRKQSAIVEEGLAISGSWRVDEGLRLVKV
jgi:hypothetical protein